MREGLVSQREVLAGNGDILGRRLSLTKSMIQWYIKDLSTLDLLGFLFMQDLLTQNYTLKAVLAIINLICLQKYNTGN